LEKQLRIDRLEEQVASLRSKLRHQERSGKETPFGSSTPSSKILLKPNSLAERQARRGGGKPGHTGRGRARIDPATAARVERVAVPVRCPDCGTRLTNRRLRRRGVIDCEPVQVEKRVLELESKSCPKCGRTVEARAPGVLPKGLYGNQLLVHVTTQHLLYGQTLGQIEKQTGVPYSSLLAAMHALAARLDPVVERLLEKYRREPVKHADETGWRTDGQNGYAWLFATPELSIFRFRQTRSASVVREVFGPKRLPGTLVVDRYAAYNAYPGRLQYCYAHLLRDLKDLSREFPDNAEIRTFVDTLAPLLAAAMHARALRGSDRLFRQQAALIERQIHDCIGLPANHPAVQNFQDIFRDNPKRLFHWAHDRRVPADNNLAERDLRPLVIARKISFGSQSVAGAHTREVLMSVLHSLQKQTTDVPARLKAALDRLAQDPAVDLFRLLFPAKAP
jgi:hypothetical protein